MTHKIFDENTGNFKYFDENNTEVSRTRYEYLLQLATQCPVVANSKVSSRLLTLPTDSAVRKGYPILSGCLKYFPAAIAGVANVSKSGNDKHNPGQELHHARSKSTDHGDCIVRHLMDTEDLLAAVARGNTTITPEAILLEANQLVWRALAYSQRLHEEYGAPMAPAAKP